MFDNEKSDFSYYFFSDLRQRAFLQCANHKVYNVCPYGGRGCLRWEIGRKLKNIEVFKVK